MPEITQDVHGLDDAGPLLARRRASVQRAGLFEPAEQYAREALDRLRHGQLPEMHPLAAACLEDLGVALAGLKRYREAIPALEKALDIYRGLGPAYAKTADRVQVVLNQVQNLEPIGFNGRLALENVRYF